MHTKETQRFTSWARRAADEEKSIGGWMFDEKHEQGEIYLKSKKGNISFFIF